MTPTPRTPEQAQAFIGALGGVLPPHGPRRPWPGLWVVVGHGVPPGVPESLFLFVQPYRRPTVVRVIPPAWFYQTPREAAAFVDPERN